MRSKILIVEDQFVEAYGLRLILENAGYVVCSIAASVEDALRILNSENPDIVLIDIFLETALTGIDLARILAERNIPFIYLSANSNASTFEEAKATQPYGFLVKPFRENDVLIALDIATYRHRHAMELIQKQSHWLNTLLAGIKPEDNAYPQQLQMLVKAFQPYLPFDYAIVDLDIEDVSPQSVCCFKRIDYDQYASLQGWNMLEALEVSVAELNAYRRLISAKDALTRYNQEAFMGIIHASVFIERLHYLYDLKACMSLQMQTEAGYRMQVSFFNVAADSFTTEHIRLLYPLRPMIGEILGNVRQQKDNAAATVKTDKCIKAKPEPLAGMPNIVGRSPGLLQVLDQVMQVADSESSVLIMGETGVGKEAIVQTIHQLSKRKNKPLVKINCAAIPESLIEAELFGYEKGAFTGANEKRIGKFEQAQGGTIFLDEIGEMPLEIQSKLLRVIQEKELERLGGRTTYKLDVRIVAATNRDLHKEVAAGNFRIDLYYRINVFPITLPPLRDRKDDIPLLAEHFLQKYATSSGKPLKVLSDTALQQLVNYTWPGNIRQLQHLMERYVLITPGQVINTVSLPAEATTEAAPPLPEPEKQNNRTASLDKEKIMAALKQSNGRISGKGGASALLGLPPSTLAYKMKKLGIGWQFLLE